MNGIGDSMQIGQYQYAILLFYDIKHAIISITFTTAWFENFDNIIFLNSPNSIIKHTIHLLTTNERCAFFFDFSFTFFFSNYLFFIHQPAHFFYSISIHTLQSNYLYLHHSYFPHISNQSQLSHSFSNQSWIQSSRDGRH